MEEIDLPNEISKNLLNEILRSELKTDNYKVHITMGSNAGDNYIGIVYRVVAKIYDEKSDDIDLSQVNRSKLSLIVKLPPQHLIRREQFFARPCFLKECLVYDEILPLFRKFQISKGIIPKENGFHEIAKCYKTSAVEFNEALFFEDLKCDGFQMFDRHQEQTMEHATHVLQVLGKLHAISFALRDQNMAELMKYTKLDDLFVLRQNDECLIEYINAVIQRAINTLKPDNDKELMLDINSIFSGGVMPVLLKLINGENAEPYSVICHGDCWNNNFLFKYENEKPIDIRLLDWQVTRYASPACDLTYYIFCSTTKSFRDQHYSDMLKCYYESFSVFLTRLGSNPSEMFPYPKLEEQMKQCGLFGFVMSAMVLPMFTSLSEDIPDLDKISVDVSKDKTVGGKMFNYEKTQGIYEARMSDIIYDINSFGYIEHYKNIQN